MRLIGDIGFLDIYFYLGEVRGDAPVSLEGRTCGEGDACKYVALRSEVNLSLSAEEFPLRGPLR